MRRARIVAMAALAVLLAASPGLAQDDAARAKLDAEIKLTVGVTFQNNGMDQEALTRFEEAIALDPDNGSAHFLAATALSGMKRYSDALPHLQRARDLNVRVEAGRLDWFEGESRYWTGDYDAALTGFQAAVGADPQDAYGHFYLGLTQMRLGRDSDGIASLDRAVALDPTLGSTGAYYAGKQFYDQGNPERARQEFEKALDTATEQNVQDASSNYLAALQPAAPPGPRKFRFRVGYFLDGDSNVVLAPSDPTQTTVSGESDGRSVLQFRVAGYPVISSGNNAFGMFLNFYQSVHFDLNQFDLTAPQAILSYTWGKDPLGYMAGPITVSQTPIGRTPVVFSLQYGYNYYLLDGDSFLRTNEFGASIKIPEGQKTATQIDLDYRDNTYFNFQARTGTYAQARVKQWFHLGRPAYTMEVGLRFAQNDANAIEGDSSSYTSVELGDFWIEDGGISNDYDLSESEIFTNLSFSLPRRVSLAFQLAYIMRDFDNLVSQADTQVSWPPPPNDCIEPNPWCPNREELREDKFLVAATSIVYSFGPRWSLQFGVAYYDQNSNKDFYTYDRVVASAGFNWVY